MAELIDIMMQIVGTPANDIEHTALYFVTCMIALMVVCFVPYCIKLIISLIREF